MLCMGKTICAALTMDFELRPKLLSTCTYFDAASPKSNVSKLFNHRNHHQPYCRVLSQGLTKLSYIHLHQASYSAKHTTTKTGVARPNLWAFTHDS
jgi:hypothetical protein